MSTGTIRGMQKTAAPATRDTDGRRAQSRRKEQPVCMEMDAPSLATLPMWTGTGTTAEMSDETCGKQT